MKTEQRKLENELAFRGANEAIRDVQEELSFDDRELPFLCECYDEQCHTVVLLRSAEYQAVRANPTQFVVAPGHEPEQVVAQKGRYDIVDKQDLM